MLTAERLRELLDYDPETGVFRWGVKPTQRMNIGDVDVQGYREITVDRRNYLADCLAFLYMNGKWPTHQVDHRNLDKRTPEGGICGGRRTVKISRIRGCARTIGPGLRASL